MAIILGRYGQEEQKSASLHHVFVQNYLAKVNIYMYK